MRGGKYSFEASPLTKEDVMYVVTGDVRIGKSSSSRPFGESFPAVAGDALAFVGVRCQESRRHLKGGRIWRFGTYRRAWRHSRDGQIYGQPRKSIHPSPACDGSRRRRDAAPHWSGARNTRRRGRRRARDRSPFPPVCYETPCWTSLKKPAALLAPKPGKSKPHLLPPRPPRSGTRRPRNTTKIVLFATKRPRRPGTIACYFRWLHTKFVARGINEIFGGINEFGTP